MGERLHGMQEVRGSSPLSSTFWNKRPFGEYVEGLSYCGAKTCVNEPTVQPDDFEDLTFFGIVRRKPPLSKGLRKFKHPRRQFGVFVLSSVENLQLKHD